MMADIVGGKVRDILSTNLRAGTMFHAPYQGASILNSSAKAVATMRSCSQRAMIFESAAVGDDNAAYMVGVVLH